MTERWLCLDCDRVTQLDRHGYAECCGSDNVTPFLGMDVKPQYDEPKPTAWSVIAWAAMFGGVLYFLLWMGFR